jgi:hypothetical protein
MVGARICENIVARRRDKCIDKGAKLFRVFSVESMNAVRRLARLSSSQAFTLIQELPKTGFESESKFPGIDQAQLSEA